MKTLVLSMISIAATVAAMTACTSESDPIEDLNPKDAKVEIKLKTGVVDVTTKAELNYADNKTTFGDNVPVQLLRWDAESSTYAAPTWANVISNTATISNTNITLQDNQKYYDKTGKYAFFIGFYPTGVNAIYKDGSVAYSNVDGKMDILCTKAISAGNSSSAGSSTDIEFKHMLSQVKITLKGNDVAKNIFGKIKSVTLKSIPHNLDLTLGDTPSIAANATEKDVKDISLLSTSETSIDLSASGITYSAMIVPLLGSSEDTKLQIEITTEKSENPILIDVNDLAAGMESGTTNNINLTFKDKITVTTSIADWEATTDKDIEYGN